MLEFIYLYKMPTVGDLQDGRKIVARVVDAIIIDTAIAGSIVKLTIQLRLVKDTIYIINYYYNLTS